MNLFSKIHRIGRFVHKQTWFQHWSPYKSEKAANNIVFIGGSIAFLGGAVLCWEEYTPKVLPVSKKVKLDLTNKLEALPISEEAKLGRYLVSHLRYGYVERLPKSLRSTEPQVHEQKKCVHTCLALFDADMSSSIERMNFHKHDVFCLCVNPNSTNLTPSEQKKFIDDYINYQISRAFLGDNDKQLEDPSCQLPKIESTPRFVLNSGTLARVVLSENSSDRLVPLDRDEIIYEKAITMLLQEIDTFAKSVTSPESSNVLKALLDDKHTRSTLVELLAPFRIPVRYWVPGEVAPGVRGKIIIGLHWEPFIRRKYPAVAQLIEEVASYGLSSDPPFPSEEAPNFQSQYAVQERLKFAVPKTFLVDCKMEQLCTDDINSLGCKHFRREWWGPASGFGEFSEEE